MSVVHFEVCAVLSVERMTVIHSSIGISVSEDPGFFASNLSLLITTSRSLFSAVTASEISLIVTSIVL